MATTQRAYDELIGELRQTALLASCGNVLSWDEQTGMPPGGAELRAEQLALLAGLTHERSTSPRIGELLAELESNGRIGADDGVMGANIRETRRKYDRVVKLPRRLVEELSRTATLAQQAWVEARKKSDFAAFRPWLEKTIQLKREEASCVGSKTGVPYDALLDDYEPGMTSAEVAAVFKPLRERLVPLVGAIRDSGRGPDIGILERRYPVEQQRAFSLYAARKIGFDFSQGRLDVAAHPFCSGFGPGDCRLTTRYDERHFPGAFFGTLHEAGHGMYEQGLEKAAFGTPVGEAASLGIHESQSRMWENFVGRSRSFWQHFYPTAQAMFPEALGETPVDDFYAAMNDVRPSLIRVEADEATYNLHIMLRFELEQPLISGDLQAADVPGVWNETFAGFFGMTPPDDAHGCLQDIHWSIGSFGYFPTYALGNMYAAQFFDAARGAIGNLDEQFARGEFGPLLGWLRENIHRHGKLYPAARLVERVTGKPLSHDPLLRHLHAKLEPIYGL